LTIADKALEKEVEQGVIDHIQKILLEIGAGFAFVGRQYPLAVDGVDYFLYLLFYHFNLKCFCVIELKAVEFKPKRFLQK
jgi:predicted nuclease of restriction endonuclease-like (RecB) superfamily